MTHVGSGTLTPRDVTDELVQTIRRHPVREWPVTLVASVVALIDVHFSDHQEPNPTGGTVLTLVTRLTAEPTSAS